MRFFFALIILAGACAYRNESIAPDPDAADLAVYRAVMDSMFVPRTSASRVTQVTLMDSTETLDGQTPTGLIKLFSQLPNVDTTAVLHLATRSQEAHPINVLARAGFRVPVVLVNRQALSSLPRQDPEAFWLEFYRRYPGSSGIIKFSPVGYGEKGDVAVLMVDQGCGSLCGIGYIVALRRDGYAWRIVDIRQTWVS